MLTYAREPLPAREDSVLATVYSRAQFGMQAPPVTIDVHFTPGAAEPRRRRARGSGGQGSQRPRALGDHLLRLPVAARALLLRQLDGEGLDTIAPPVPYARPDERAPRAGRPLVSLTYK